MKLNGNLIFTFFRFITFLLIGLINTLLIRDEFIGSWKNYIGYALLILAIVDFVFLISIILKQEKYEKTRLTFLKVLAVIIPFYFVYFPQLQSETSSTKTKNLWWFVAAGFVLYSIAILIISFY